VCSLIALLVACAPDESHTAFLCAVDRDCPAGQRCFTERCRRSDVRGNGIACGATVCAPTQQCCLDGANPARCIRAGDRCFGLGALCDDKTDCAMGDKCCADDSILSCNADCAVIACQAPSDCPEGRPNCCRGEAAVPWGTCSRTPC
jgi:hypothetical protein